MPVNRVYLQSEPAPFLNHASGETEMLMESPNEYLEADPDELADLYGRQPDEADRDLIFRLRDKPEVFRGSV